VAEDKLKWAVLKIIKETEAAPIRLVRDEKFGSERGGCSSK
jgi:hypothetical protein